MILRNVRVARQLQLAQERIARTDQLHTGRIDVDDTRGVAPAADPERLAPWIVRHRAAVLLHAVADPRPVPRPKIALVLDRGGASQNAPVPPPALRPVCDEERGIDVRRDGAKEL